ncbi:MAG TPA: response regulator [Candidatus Acidoferrales bacterium]|nr:response regulator [Candidatus Acidoferrales bacterium]
MAAVVAYIDDIFFQAKLSETARQIGIQLTACATADTFTAEIAKNTPKLIVIDLNARANPFDAIEIAKRSAPNVPVIGFFSHVQTELAERARVAGCGEVMPRSKFTRELATILARAKSQS